MIYAGKLVRVRRSEVSDWCDDWFWSVFDLWWTWRTLQALPFAGGWAEQPAHLVEAIVAAEAAYKAVENDSR